MEFLGNRRRFSGNAVARACLNLLLRPPAVGDNAAMEADPPQTDPPKRKRRWYQFSRRSAFGRFPTSVRDDLTIRQRLLEFELELGVWTCVAKNFQIQAI
jgi:hypothetical protein